MQGPTADLYDRGTATLLASWEQYARGANGAALRRLPGVAAAVFPHDPERAIYNNALLERDLPAVARADAIAAMEDVYESAGVARFAAWVHESDEAMSSDLRRRGYELDEVTRAMGIALDDIPVPEPKLELAPADWSEHLRIAGVPAGLLSGIEAAAFQILIARDRSEQVATGIAFDFDTDCGIYNVGTLEAFRKRGLGTAVTARLLYDARARGCETASLQSTPIAERLYAGVGFRDLGRILEYVSGDADRTRCA
jgi:ribosomal protein S18 acetylase RimI-like enzyme